jgi:hypothetical protein
MKSMNRPQRRGHETSPGIVEERPRETLPPRIEDGLERAAVEMRTPPTLDAVSELDRAASIGAA